MRPVPMLINAVRRNVSHVPKKAGLPGSVTEAHATTPYYAAELMCACFYICFKVLEEACVGNAPVSIIYHLVVPKY
jgi:hypothetical protein